ncbi:conjugal transfer protein TraR [Paenibacillus sp. FSL H7-0326]|uniref:TraR/DksA C4-type zinc finger protein n=1 Tax=Paenibacillus sp. FSL H7-0326 TaxID=1921144 RepID=UPI00096BE411|nr:TraR/DksA C4-type zinc finger protein [Paenibacillus sp. FSL H7-0326]OMC70891.1 conjugal transfer protein TraR [Paenibacillus sp. FSL H7-0326]
MNTIELTNEELKTLKSRLLEEKENIQAHFQINQDGINSEDNSLLDATGELSSVDNHPADIGTETYERARDQAIDDQQSEKLDQIEKAIGKMQEQSYGLCEECGKPIPYERLEIIPYTSYCIEHAEQEQQGELNEYRPVEEQVMTKPPRGAGEISQRNAGKFDNAEAWEAVKEYGTADSPATSTKRDVEDYEEL